MGGGALPRRGHSDVVPWQASASVDIGSALISATCAAPIILTIDKAVVQAMAGTHGLFTGIGAGLAELVRRPHHLVRQVGFWMTVGVYGATYTTANLMDTICDRSLDPDDPNSDFIHGTAKLLCTTAVNMGSGVAKDAAFARMFGANATSTAPTPPMTYGLFAFRDLLTILGGFTLPPIVASALSTSGTVEEHKAGAVAQVISPMGMQLACTPLHLGALNVYNAPTMSLGERVADVGKTAPSAIPARMLRFCAAYGIGGLLNKALLKNGHEYLGTAYGSQGLKQQMVMKATDENPSMTR